MIELKLTPEIIMDMFTPGIIGPVECVKGLPPMIMLKDVKYEDNIITYLFDDGEEEKTTSLVLEFKRPEVK